VRLEQQRLAIARACHRLASDGLVIDTAGNVSAAGEDGEHIAITPTGAVLADLQPGDIAVVDRSGGLVEGPLAPTSELDLHLGIYAQHGAGAVVHTHAPMATALSCVLDELPCVHYSMLLLGGTVPVARYETFGTPELANAVVESLAGHTAALMANHGAVTFAEDVDNAVERMVLLEWACTVYWRARAIGEPSALDEDDRAAVVKAALERGYGETKRVGEESAE
jgi:L-fuculose-phosphate aldolase